MKVSNLLHKMKISSNATVYVLDVRNGSKVKLTNADIKYMDRQSLMDMTVNLFEIIDNELTIFAEGRA